MRSYEVFRYLMYKHDIRKADVIRATGVTRPVLVNWEHGKEPSLATLRRLADYFHVPVTEFFEEKKGV